MEYIWLVLLGFGAGFINAVAGGGSTLTLPMLIFMGLPVQVANGTNRIAILLQNIFANIGYRSKSVNTAPFDYQMGISALVGSVFGVYLAKWIDPQLFKNILALVMVLAVVNIFIKKKKRQEIEFPRKGKKYILSLIAFFFIGVYGGFIQVGTGILIILLMDWLHRSSLLQTNSVKVVVVLIYSLVALSLFAWQDLVSWKHGLVLAIGNSSGALISSRMAVKKGDNWIKIIFAIAVFIMTLKLIGIFG